MEDQSKNEASENPKNENRDPKDEIPYWLQGLEETGPLKPEPESNEESSAEGWVKETEPTASSEGQLPDPVPGDENDTTEEVPTSPNPYQGSGDAPPNWLNELSGVDPTTPDIQGQSKPSPEWISSPKDSSDLEAGLSGEETDKIVLDNPPDAMEQTEPASTPDADFIDISEMDFDRAPMPPVDEPDELLPEDEDLPSWLHELISERPAFQETNGYNRLPSEEISDEILDGPTKSVAVPQGEDLEPEEMDATQVAGIGTEPEETPIPDFSEEETLPVAVPFGQEAVEDNIADEWPGETVAEEWAPTENITAESPLEEFPKDGTEEDISPSDLSDVTADSSPAVDREPPPDLVLEAPFAHLPAFESESATPEEGPTEGAPMPEEDSEGKPDPSSEQTRPVIVADTLRFAKYVLDQGDVVGALDIINAYIEQAAYLNEIKSWLTDAIGGNSQNDSELWESLGDIAVCQGKYQEAFVAYTNAIHILLMVKEANEIN